MAIQEKFPSIRPSLNLDFANTNTLDPRVTFSRASTATYYDGKTVAKAEENLLSRSEQFDDSAWLPYGGTISANTATTAAPNSSNTADQLTANNTTSTKGVTRVAPSVSGTITLSVFAKAGTGRFFTVSFSSGPGTAYVAATFDLTLGTTTQNAATGASWAFGSAVIISVGDGWYRCVLTGTIGSGGIGQFDFVLTDSGTPSYGNYARNSYIGNNETYYLWGAQLEARSSVTAYTPTTNQPITSYVPVLQTAAANVARFDHDPITGESLGLLVEESRTNLLTYSEQFDNAAWLYKNNVTITSDTVVAPDGTLSADLFTATINNTESGVRRTTTQANSTAYTMSVFAKAGTTPLFFMMNVALGSGFSGACWFNLSTGTVGTKNAGVTTASIIPVGNGWYRCSITGTTQASIANNLVDIKTADNDGSVSCVAGQSVYFWGAQLEVGAFPTSYIKTEASQVTRAADNAVMTGSNFSSWYRADEGTLLVTYSRTTSGNATGADILVSVDNGSNNNRIQIRFDTTTVDAVVLANSIMFDAPGVSIPRIGTRSTTIAYKENDFVFVHAGAAVQTDTSGVVPLVNRLGIGSGVFAEHANAYIRKIAYYPARLSNTNLQALTT